ncbi:hypothetical protein LJR045_000248 [Microbacterium sp. LjRoot45]|uniref:hypothetical protein n=1 Tax=Microbacterium sp. LjRoot45 TaxID=3342329 RepID=UPI003ECDDE0A
MTTTDRTDHVAVLLHAADPYPAERDELTSTHLALRNRIVAESERTRVPRVRRWRPTLRWATPLTALAATAAVVAVAFAVGAAVLDARRAPIASDPTPEVANPLYWSDFEVARDRATSAFEVRVLGDNVITADEYEEAVALYVECVRGAGLAVTVSADRAGIRSYAIGGSWDTDLVNRIAGDCSTGTISIIEDLYARLVQNPDKADWVDLVARCLVAVGFVEAPYSGTQYAADDADPDFVRRMMDDPDAAQCVATPGG